MLRDWIRGGGEGKGADDYDGSGNARVPWDFCSPHRDTIHALFFYAKNQNNKVQVQSVGTVSKNPCIISPAISSKMDEIPSLPQSSAFVPSPILFYLRRLRRPRRKCCLLVVTDSGWKCWVDGVQGEEERPWLEIEKDMGGGNELGTELGGGGGKV